MNDDDPELRLVLVVRRDDPDLELNDPDGPPPKSLSEILATGIPHKGGLRQLAEAERAAQGRPFESANDREYGEEG